MATSSLLLIIWLHFVADFVLQSTKMATNKSKSMLYLSDHAVIYGIPFMIFISPTYGFINLVLHGMVDFVTSRITSKLWLKEDKHYFFVIVGLDQAIHLTILAVTYKLLIG